MPQILAVDANCLISALLGGRAREIIFSGQFHLHSPQSTLFEVAKHLSWLAKRNGAAEDAVFRSYQLLPVVACQPSEYDAQVPLAAELIGGRDPLDIPLLALALAMKCPIWSNDQDFNAARAVQVFTTAQLLEQLTAE